MSLTARICTHQDQPWMVIEGEPACLGGQRTVIYDGPLNLASKATTKAEVDWYFERTGVPRGDLHDALRLYQRQRRAHPESAAYPTPQPQGQKGEVT